MTSLAFVCLGNICRSPTAAAVMILLVEEAGLSDRIAVESAGTAGWHVGEGPDPRTAGAARRRGIPMDHVAQQFTSRDFARFDLVLAMDDDNVDALRRMAPDDAARGRIRLLRDFDPDSPAGAAVPDPYYGGPSGFEEVIDLTTAACEGLLRRIVDGEAP